MGLLCGILLTETLTFSAVLLWKHYVIMTFIFGSGVQPSSYGHACSHRVYGASTA
jgi:hypothetical protein